MFIDAIFCSLIFLAIIKGYTKGLVLAVFSFAAIILGLLLALKLSTTVSLWLQKSTNISNYWLPFISFALIMLGVVLLAKIGAKIIEKSLQLVMLGWLNKLAGIFLFASLYIIILSIVLFYFDRLGFIKPETFATSKSYFLIKPWAPKFIEILGDTKHFF